MGSEYFSHDYKARVDSKIVNLFMKHGLAGIGAYWCIIEMLYENNGKIMRTECERIAFELRTDYDFINSIINDFDLFIVSDTEFYSNSVLFRLNLRNEKSKKASLSAKTRWYNANALQSQSESNAINKSKVNKKESKESKKDKNKQKPKKEINIDFDIFWNAYDKKEGSKPNCKKKWSKLTDEIRTKIIETLPIWKLKFLEKKYQPFPETYLNQERWNDELQQKKPEQEEILLAGMRWLDLPDGTRTAIHNMPL